MTRACWAVVLILGAAVSGHAQLLDRVLARVDGQAVLLSDVRLARAVGIGSVRAEDDDLTALRRLVDRQLTVAEVLRNQPPASDRAAIMRGVAELVTRAGGQAAATAALRAAGVPQNYLERLAQETAWVDAYTRQRFGADLAAPARAAWARDLRRRGRIECVIPDC